MAGFTFFFCSTLRNVSHFKSSRISCGRQHLLLIRREATRSQHSSSSQIFPLTCKFYHALPLQTTRLNQCINVGKVKADHHSTKQYKPDFFGTRSNWHCHTKEALVAGNKNNSSRPNSSEKETFLEVCVCLIVYTENQPSSVLLKLAEN